MAYKIVTAEQMGRIDKITIEEHGVPGIELMERAGSAVAMLIMTLYDPDTVGIVTGKGNNAGDGLVVARLLSEAGIAVKVIMTTQGENLSASGKENFEQLPEAVEVFDRLSVPEMAEIFEDCDVVVDALLGTGIKGAPRGVIGEAIAVMNSLDMPIVSIDIPSGLDADTGAAEGSVILANQTFTIGLPKRGLLLGFGPEACGPLSVLDIGFDEALMNDPEIKDHLLEAADAAMALPARPVDGHKGTFGTLLVIAGSQGYSGAAWLTTAAGLRSGTGLVFGAYPEKVADMIDGTLVEAIKIRLEGPDGAFMTHDCWKTLSPHLDRATALALGPGIGTEDETKRLVDELVCVDLPMVIDADALNCLGDKVLYLTKRQAPTVLTPHPGEMARLVGKSIEDIQSDRIGAARQLAQDSGAVVVLKGCRTVIASPDGNVFLNMTGNDGMAKGGMGDVLTGLIGGFLAQGCGALDAACAGVCIHGDAGDIASMELGRRGMTARDVLQCLPLAMQSLENPRDEIQEH